MRRRITQPGSSPMPARNEVAIISDVARKWDADVFRHLPAGSEPVFDDGESRDATLARLETQQAELPFIRIPYSWPDGFAASPLGRIATAPSLAPCP